MNASQAAALIILAGSSTLALGGLSNFYLLNGNGILYSVDGDSLHATQIHAIENGNTVVDLLDLGGGEIIVNRAFEFYRYNFYTQAEESILSASDYFETGHIGFFSGIADMGDGEIMFSTSDFSSSGTEFAAATLDLATGETSFLTQIDSPVGLYFDHHMIGDNLFLSADRERQAVIVVDTTTGSTVSVFDVGIHIGSFFDVEGDLFIMSTEGKILSFDATNGNTEFIGDITGFTGNALGASVTDPLGVFPTPSTSALLGISILVGTRRRRCP